jgi:hypothetical protein
LEFVPQYRQIIFFSSVAGGIFLAYRTEYSGLQFAFVAISAAILILVAAVGVMYYTCPPKAQLSEAKLRLTGDSRR